MPYLIIPGIDGSGADHWQSAWEADLAGKASRIAPSSWSDVDESDWAESISRSMIDGTVMIAHSLGCLAAANWLADHPDGGVDGALLVAPPDRHGPRFPGVRGFERVPVTLSVPTVVITSSDDPYCAPSAAAELAKAWGAALIQLGPLGHINASSGVGPWPGGRQLLQAFTAGLYGPART